MRGYYFSMPPDRDDPEVKEYYEELKRSGPYALTSKAGDRIIYGVCCVPEDELLNQKFLDVVQFAVKEHNLLCQIAEHQNIQLVRAVKANYIFTGAGTIYYITLEARDHNEIMKYYQAGVFVCDADCKALSQFHTAPSHSDDTGYVSGDRETFFKVKVEEDVNEQTKDDAYWHSFFKMFAPEALGEAVKEPEQKFYNPMTSTVCGHTFEKEFTCYHGPLCDRHQPGRARSPYHLVRHSPTSFVPGWKMDEEFFAKYINCSASGSSTKDQAKASGYCSSSTASLSCLSDSHFSPRASDIGNGKLEEPIKKKPRNVTSSVSIEPEVKSLGAEEQGGATRVSMQ